MTTRPKEWEHWPFDHAWYFVQSQGPATPGCVKITDQPVGGKNEWDIHVAAFDNVARTYFEAREKKIGQPMQTADGKILHVPYRALDEEADAYLQRGMKHHPDNTTVTIRTSEGTVFENVARAYWNDLIERHVKRRQQEPAVPINLGKSQIVVSFLFFDAICKDFMRRRGDMIAVGYWPELVMKDSGQMGGPPPVEGRANALQKAQIVQPDQPQAPPRPEAGIAQPGIENQELV